MDNEFKVFTDLGLDECALDLIGEGKSAKVYRHGTKAIKVFKSNKLHEAIKEREAYKLLSQFEGYLNLYDYGKDYIIVDFIEGTTLYNYLFLGTHIKKEYMDKVNEYITCAIEQGLNPNDVHLKNIIVTADESIYIIDLGRFLDKKEDNRWDDIYKIYLNYYKFLPKRWGKHTMKFIIFIYKCIERLKK